METESHDTDNQYYDITMSHATWQWDVWSVPYEYNR